MRRLQLAEIHEQSWCPVTVRDAVTDFLQFATNQEGIHDVAIPRLHNALCTLDCHQVVDLCSGGGGPWLGLHRKIVTAGEPPIQVTLTDKYPNLSAFRRAKAESNGVLDFVEEPVDATEVPRGLVGFRTLFASFHHFRPSSAKAILQDAVDNGQGIGIFELTERHPLAFLIMLSLSVYVLVHTPLVHPFRWSRILLTYIVPVIPFIVSFDGIISCIRTYSKSELEELTASLKGCPYYWEIGSKRKFGRPLGVSYAIGLPERKRGRRLAWG